MDMKAIFDTGKCTCETNNYQRRKLMNSIKKAANQDINNFEYWSNLGIAHLEKGEYEKAITACNQAIKINPENVFIYCCRGLAYCDNGEKNSGICDLMKFIELGVKYKYFREKFFLKLAAKFEEKGELKIALKVYRMHKDINFNKKIPEIQTVRRKIS